MALFKIFKGQSMNLPTEKHEGYVYFVTDTGEFYIDIDDSTRVQVNAGKLSKTIDGETIQLELENIVDTDELEEQLSNFRKKITIVPITLTPEAWIDNTQIQTVSVSGVTTDNLVTVTPIDPEIALKYGVYCCKQSLNTLDFKYLVKPIENISFNIFIEEL